MLPSVGWEGRDHGRDGEVDLQLAFYDRLKQHHADIESRYRRLTAESARLLEKASRVQPGGSTRDAVLRGPYPPFLVRGEGGWVIDADGREITDLWFNATSLPLGHCHPRVMEVARSQLSHGTAFFGPTSLDVEYAELICARLPSAERVRFTNSGTEAVMLAIQIARGFTGREKIGKFEGSYHGTYDDVFWSAGGETIAPGPPQEPLPAPGSAGLPSGSSRTVILSFNDIEATEKCIEENAADLAAILVEPIAHRMGWIPAKREFLRRLRELCDAHRIVLIFDEVMTFRVGLGGAQGLVEVTPDLTTLGKIIGGGFPVGAVAGRAEIMSVTEPGQHSRVPHFGTFSANPVTMIAGKTTLEILDQESFRAWNALGDRVKSGLTEICRGLPLRVTGIGSLFKVSATPNEIFDYRTALTVDTLWQEIASLALLNRGFLLTTKLHGCVATTTTEAQIDAFLGAFEDLVRGGGR